MGILSLKMFPLRSSLIAILLGAYIVESLEKSRWKLKSVLNNYVKRQQRQSDDDFPALVCSDDLTSGTCAGDQDKYIGRIFEAYKFRLGTIENNILKEKRIRTYSQITTNKVAKSLDFRNASLWLEATVGGDLSNPVCNGNTGSTSGEVIVQLYNNLIQCNDTIVTECTIDDLKLQKDDEVFSICKEKNLEVKDKIDECRTFDQSDPEQREDHCDCLEGAITQIDDFKKTKYDLTTEEEVKNENCIKLLSASSPLVVAQWRSCIDALIGF